MLFQIITDSGEIVMKMFMVALNQMQYFNLNPILILSATDALTIIYSQCISPASLNPQSQLCWTRETSNISHDPFFSFFARSRDHDELGKTQKRKQTFLFFQEKWSSVNYCFFLDSSLGYVKSIFTNLSLLTSSRNNAIRRQP